MVEVWNHACASFLSIENCWGSVFEGVKLENWWIQEQTVAMLMCLNSSGLHNLQVGHILYFILCRCFTCMPWEARKGATGKHIGNISILERSVIKMPMMTPWWPLYVTGSNQALRSSVTAGLRITISSHRVSRTAPSTTPSTSSIPTPGAHTNTIESTWCAIKVFLGQYNRGEDYEYHLAQYMFMARCKAQGISPSLQFLHLVANTDSNLCDVPSTSDRDTWSPTQLGISCFRLVSSVTVSLPWCHPHSHTVSLLATYNLYSAVNFPTRVTKHSSTAIDNIFMNKNSNSNYSIESHINGLSDHDTQILVLVLRNINIRSQKTQPTTIRQINETNIAQFKLHLSEENWPNTFSEEDMELSFNNFLNEYLRFFNQILS